MGPAVHYGRRLQHHAAAAAAAASISGSRSHNLHPVFMTVKAKTKVAFAFVLTLISVLTSSPPKLQFTHVYQLEGLETTKHSISCRILTVFFLYLLFFLHRKHKK